MSESHSPPVSTANPAQLCALFFLQGLASNIWYVPLANILTAHGYERFIPFALSSPSIAAFISPMIAATLADRSVPAERLVRWIACGVAVMLALLGWGIEHHWSPALLMPIVLANSIIGAPLWSLTATVVFSTLRDPQRQFGPIRVWATFGWMCGGVIVSHIFHADKSPAAGYIATGAWLIVAAYTFTLPHTAPKAAPSHSTGWQRWKEVLGLDALGLLRNRDHRAVIIGSALYMIPLAAFYPYASKHLAALGEKNVAASMSLAQVTEVIAMYALAPLLARVRLKWVFLAGIACAVARYGMFILGGKTWLLVGIALHGLCYTLYYVTAQIYLEKRVGPEMRARSQALGALFINGFGNLIGIQAAGLILVQCTSGPNVDWAFFWMIEAVICAVVFVWFALSYRGTGQLTRE